MNQKFKKFLFIFWREVIVFNVALDILYLV